MVDEKIKEIREYLWAKYIDFSHHGDDMDEAAVLSLLEEHHRTCPVAVDGETYYLGILYFELAYLAADPNMEYLARAARILRRYQQHANEYDWEDITDRVEEAEETLSGLEDAELETLLAKVDSELDTKSDRTDGGGDRPAPTTEVVDGMVFVIPGSFISGAGNVTKDLKAFWIDEFPVTNTEYRKFVEATGYRSPKFWSEGRLREPGAPVVGVSWYDAFKFAAFAGKSLPTKDQWEKSVRGTKGMPYPWGTQLTPELAHYEQEDGTDAIAPNGQFPGNVSEFGVRDALGNVWEWTDSPDPQDSEQRVICGGSWLDPADFIRCDQHLAAYPKDKYDNIGFRCARIAEE